MKKKDVADALEYVGAYYGVLKKSREEEQRKTEQRKLDRQMASVLKTYMALRKDRDAHLKAKMHPPKRKDVRVGECICGEGIFIGERYSVSVDGQTKIKRACPGRDCMLTNEVVLTVRALTTKMGYTFRDCLCGEPLVGPNELRYAPVVLDLKGKPTIRTSSVRCRACGCSWSFKMRDYREDGKDLRSTSMTVKACHTCRGSEEFRGMTPVRKGEA